MQVESVEPAETFNTSSKVAREVSMRYPEDRISFCAAATISISSRPAPNNRFFRKLLRSFRRGVVVITDRRIVLKSSFLSPTVLVLFALIAFGGYGYYSGEDGPWTWLLVIPSLLLIRRRPFHFNLPFNELSEIRIVEERRGSTVNEVLVIKNEGKSFHVASSLDIRSDVREDLESKIAQM